MTLNENLPEFRHAVEHGTVADAMTQLDLVLSKVKVELLKKKLTDQQTILNTVYQDFSVPLQPHHRKTLLALYKELEAAARKGGRGGTTIIGSIVNTRITNSNVSVGGTIHRKDEYDEEL